MPFGLATDASDFTVFDEGFSDMTTTPTPDTIIATTIASARAEIDGEAYVPVSDCVDWLLDCLNVAERPDVKNVIVKILPEFTNGSLRTTESFMRALDDVEMALQVDAVFDEFGRDPEPTV